MFVTSIFSFFEIAFKRVIKCQDCADRYSRGGNITRKPKHSKYYSSDSLSNHYQTLKFNPFPNKPWFLSVCNTSLLKTLWEKEKLLVTSNFSFSHSVFYPLGELCAIFIKFEIVVCKYFQFGRVQNCRFGKG